MHRPFVIVKPCVCVCVCAFWLFVCISDRHNKRKGFSEFKNSQLCCIIFNAFLWDVFRVYWHGYLRLSCLLCHIDQWHCHRPLNIPCTHHSPVSDLHPHLILLQLLCITLSQYFLSIPIISDPSRVLLFLPSTFPQLGEGEICLWWRLGDYLVTQ